MAANGHWEVVGKNKPGKQSNNASGKLTKDQQKKFAENMPKLEDLPPLKESQTLYGAFNEKRKKTEDSKRQENGKVHRSPSGGSLSKKKQNEKKKKTDQEPVYQSINDAVNALDKEEIQILLDNVRAKFPDSEIIWLKDLVSYLNIKLATANEHENVVFSDKPMGYPWNCMPKFIHSLIASTTKKCSAYTIISFFDYCLTSLAESIVQGAPSTGFRIFIQFLGQDRSFVNDKMLAKLDASMKKHSNRSQVCLSLMWAAGQMGIKNFNDGLRVWLSLMFPMINLKSYSKYVVDYLVNLFKKHGDVKSGIDVLGVEEFFSVMDFMFSNNSLPPNIFKQFKDLYPKVKEASFGRHPETVLHLFFPSFLQRLQPNASKALKKELFYCLALCLETDIHTCSVWRQLYTKNLLQSSILLEHLFQNWKASQKNLPVSMLKKTLSAFHVTNSELGSNQEGLDDCRKFVEGLLNKMSGTHFPWRTLSLIFLSIVGGLLVYDIHLHGEFQKSKTGALLKDSGLILVFNQAWTKINVYSNLTVEWTKNNVPIYLKTFTNTCEPYFQLVVVKLKDACIFLLDYTEGGRNWISSQVHEMLIVANEHAPKIFQNCLQYATVALDFAKRWFDVIYAFVLHYFNILVSWIQVNVLTKDFNVESVQKAVTDSVTSVQAFMTRSYSWLVTQAKSVVG